ncbi:MAG: VOC family protein [Synechococcales bacterium]|nr:VOC family protein [Synechococcales bacterium]
MALQLRFPLHAAVLVSDLAKAEHFYGTVLGLPKVDRSLKYPGAWYQLGDYQIHLIEDANCPDGLHNREKWGRNRHIALAVADIEAAKAHFLDHGCELQMSASGRPALFVHDPDGNVVELTEVK